MRGETEPEFKAVNIEYQVETPLAFLVFNRPDLTARVFAEITKVRPNKLLVVADGPRPDHPEDSKKCAAVRSIIEQVDWDCEVLKNYSEINLGCKRRVSSGLDWVFNTVDRAIVLEDDVLPHPTFFRFCDELLEKYAEDDRVGAICGCNWQNGITRDHYSYFFSRYNYAWGWASWSRAWKSYDVAIKLWPFISEEGYLRSLLPDPQSFNYWTNIFQDVYQGKIETWDYQWTFACWVNNMLAVLPQVNLICNIGFGEGATHTTDPFSKVAGRPTECITFPLVHPDFVMRHEIADAYNDGQFGISTHSDKHCEGCYYRKIREIYDSHKQLLRLRRLIELIRHGQFRIMVERIARLLKN